MKYLNLKNMLPACACAIATTVVSAEPMDLDAYKAFVDNSLHSGVRDAELTTEECHVRVDAAVQFGLITSEAGDWSKANDIVPTINFFQPYTIQLVRFCANL